MASTPKRPRDPNQLAKLIVDIATGEAEAQAPEPPKRGQQGGVVGGKARSESLTPEKRQEIARLAAQARWKK